MPSPSSKTRDALTKARAEGIDDYLRENDIIDDFDPKKYRQEEKRLRIKDKEEEKRLANKPAAMAAAANELAIESGYSSAAREAARLAMEGELKESTRVGGSNKKTKRRKSRMARFLHKKTKKRKSRMRRFPHKRRKSRMRRFPHKRRNSRMR